MIQEKNPETQSSKLILRGIHFELTDDLKALAQNKASRLLRRNERIIRLRVDLEHDQTRGASTQFIAKGHIEIGGPDLLASVASDDVYKSLDLLVDKLDSLLRRRHSVRKDKRNHPHGVELAVALPKT